MHNNGLWIYFISFAMYVGIYWNNTHLFFLLSIFGKPILGLECKNLLHCQSILNLPCCHSVNFYSLVIVGRPKVWDLFFFNDWPITKQNVSKLWSLPRQNLSNPSNLAKRVGLWATNEG